MTATGPGGSKDSFGKAEAITLPEAMDKYTINSARQLRMANGVGLIKVGMLADVIIVDQDPYTAPVTDLHKTKAIKTIINEEIVYQR